jgi:AbrB family looped-hinge helix DNA binding protein
MSEKCVSMIGRKQDTRLYGTVKVGDRGQVVIPAEARKELDTKPGDLLLVMAGRTAAASPWLKPTL